MNNSIKLSNIKKLFSIAESKSLKKYIILANDKKKITYFMEDKRGSLIQTSYIDSKKQNAGVIVLEQPDGNPKTLSDFVYKNSIYESFKNEAIQYLIRKYTRLQPEGKKVAEDLMKSKSQYELLIEPYEIKDEIDDKEIKDLELNYAEAIPEWKERISKIIERGAIKKIKKIYEFKCKICEALKQNPLSFKKRIMNIILKRITYFLFQI